MKPLAHTAAVVGSGFLLLVALAQPAWAYNGCGNENEGPCNLDLSTGLYCDTGLITSVYFCGCFLPDPIFGGCLLPNICRSCTNYLRRTSVIDQLFMGGWADWALKNQRDQLAQDEPLNWVMQIGTHNSYNTFHDAHSLVELPNQVFSTTDQLRAGARLILFDNYWLGGAARLCHSPVPEAAPEICFYTPAAGLLYFGPVLTPSSLIVHPSMRYYSNGIQEISNWLQANPNEIVIMDFEEYVPQMGGPDEAINGPIRQYLGNNASPIGDTVLKPHAVPPASFTGSIKLAAGNNVPQLTITHIASGSGNLYKAEEITGPGIPAGTYLSNPPFTGGTGGPINLGNVDGNPVIEVPSETITTLPFYGVFPDRWPTKREMLAAGKRVIILDNKYHGPGTDKATGPEQDFNFSKANEPSEFLFSEFGTAEGSYGTGTWFANNQRRWNQFGNGGADCFKDPRGKNFATDFDLDFHNALFTKATLLVEERDWDTFPNGHDFSLAPFPWNLLAKEPLPTRLFGRLFDQGIVDATDCNYSFVVLDRYSQAPGVPDGTNPGIPDPYGGGTGTQLPSPLTADFHRQALAVWSWKSGDRGQNGDCAMLEGGIVEGERRWISTKCNTLARFACGMPRSESGKDPLKWQDPLGNHWKVTKAKGAWADGQLACETEFGSDTEFGTDGFVFSVPRNGYQNRKLKDASVAADVREDNIWLNYRQKDLDDHWVIGGVTGGGGSSAPPVAKAGPNQVVECGNNVKLNAGGSYSRDGGPLAYKWQGPFGIRTTPIVNLNTPRDLPLGVDPIALMVTDSHQGTATDSLTVTVKDTTPPSLTVSLSTGSAPRHSHFVPVRATIAAKDSCDSEPPSIKLVSIEPVRGKDHEEDHDKDHGNDHEKDHEKDHDRSDIDTYVRGAKFGTDDRGFELARGEEHDRRYIVTYSATDLSGNVTKRSAQVVVEEAHDRREAANDHDSPLSKHRND
jgi:hypothetical protein